jgi:hypothetical protein
MPKFSKSKAKNKKYAVRTPGGKLINFGDSRMQQFKDSTGLGLYSHLDHGDSKRRKSYLARAKGIKDKNGNLTWKNPESANYYSVKYLW